MVGMALIFMFGVLTGWLGALVFIAWAEFYTEKHKKQ